MTGTGCDDFAMTRILVGVDGSPAAAAALEWAVDHADDDDTVVVCHIWSLPAVAGFESPMLEPGPFKEAAEKLVAEVAAPFLGRDDGPAIETGVAYGHAGSVLIDLSADADQVIVGSRGYGGFKGLLLGSVSTYVVHHACCPVTVVPAR